LNRVLDNAACVLLDCAEYCIHVYTLAIEHFV